MIRAPKGGFGATQGFDSVLFDGLINRALLLQKLNKQKEKIILALIIIAILGIGYLAYQNIQLEELLRAASTVTAVV